MSAINVPERCAGQISGVHGVRDHRAWQVAPDVWVTLVMPSTPGVSSQAGRARRLYDRLAGRLAEVAALRAACRPRANARMARSHSAGAGAAAVAPEGWGIGVDVMRFDRVTARHAYAVADAGEIAAMEPAVGARRTPAVIWALKEAAMKATGRAGLGTMRQWVVQLAAADGSAELHHWRSPRHRVETGWRIDGNFVCAWAIIPPGEMPSPPPRLPCVT